MIFDVERLLIGVVSTGAFAFGIAITVNLRGFRDRINRKNDTDRERRGETWEGAFWGVGSDDDLAIQHGIVRFAGWFLILFGVIGLWGTWNS